MKANKFILKMSWRDWHLRTVKKGLIVFEKWPFCLFSPCWFTWAPYKQRKCKVVAEESVQRVLSLKIRDLSVSWLVECYFPYSWWLLLIRGACLSFFWDVCRQSKMCAVPSYTRSEFLLWRINDVDVWGREVGWNPSLPMVSINFFAFYLLR